MSGARNTRQACGISLSIERSLRIKVSRAPKSSSHFPLKGRLLDPQAFTAPPRLFQALLGRSKPVRIDEQDTLFNQGDLPRGLFLLVVGEVTLQMRSDEGESIMYFRAGPGSVLGLPAVVSQSPYTLSAIVHKGSEMRFVDREEFDEVLRETPSLYPLVLDLLASEVRAARQAAFGL